MNTHFSAKRILITVFAIIVLFLLTRLIHHKAPDRIEVETRELNLDQISINFDTLIPQVSLEPNTPEEKPSQGTLNVEGLENIEIPIIGLEEEIKLKLEEMFTDPKKTLSEIAPPTITENCE